MRYAVVIERAIRNYSGYVPDLPGCIATGATVQETMSNLQVAIRMHVDGMIDDGVAVPDPTTHVDYINTDVVAGLASGPRPQSAKRFTKGRGPKQKTVFRGGTTSQRK